MSAYKTKSSKNILDIKERLAQTGRDLSASKIELDSDALRRIEKEIITIGKIVKTQFGDGNVGRMSYISTNEDFARVIQLEVEKKELELKLKTAREAMSEYISTLNDKVNDLRNRPHVSMVYRLINNAVYWKSTTRIRKYYKL